MDLILRAVIIYVFVYAALRSMGKRELGQLSPFELVLLFVIGDLVQQSITQHDTSLTAAVLVISTLTLLVAAESFLTSRSARFRRVLEGEPTIVVRDGQLLEGALARQRMDTTEVLTAARARGIANLSEVAVAILETDGSISFITRSGATLPGTAGKPAQ